MDDGSFFGIGIFLMSLMALGCFVLAGGLLYWSLSVHSESKKNQPDQ
jgi:hypothetical protein